MTSSTIVFGGLLVAVALGVLYLVWRMWGDHEADRQYARIKAGADTDVHRALQGKSFTVGESSALSDGDLLGQFGWLKDEHAWGLRLGNPRSSLRSLAGTSMPLWVLQGDERSWVRHPDGNVRLKAYNTDIAFVLPQTLKDGAQVRLGENVGDRITA